jgi:hypothetical protein
MKERYPLHPIMPGTSIDYACCSTDAELVHEACFAGHFRTKPNPTTSPPTQLA